MDSASTGKYRYISKINPLQAEIASVLRKNATVIEGLRDERYSCSQDVERELQADLSSLGFIRSATVDTVAGLFIPISDFEIDFFHEAHCIGVLVVPYENTAHGDLRRSSITPWPAWITCTISMEAWTACCALDTSGHV